MPGPELISLASKLAGDTVVTLEPLCGGGNNRLFRLRTASGALYALKRYLQQPGDPRDRFGVETGAVGFLNDQAVTGVPRLLARDRPSATALYEWIDGQPVHSPGAVEIDTLLELIRNLKKVGASPASGLQPPASAACFSATALLRQIEQRQHRLQPVLAAEPSLRQFIRTRFTPRLAQWRQRAEHRYARLGIDPDTPVPKPHRTLSPSDFGFHNALAARDGRLVFLDFEYFGWDDPVKMGNDLLLHPGMNLAENRTGPDRPAERLLRGLEDIFADSFFFSQRLRILFPLFALCWCLILLNEFIPDRWARRAAAKGLDVNDVDEWQRVKRQQLEKSQRLLSNLTGEKWKFLHG